MSSRYVIKRIMTVASNLGPGKAEKHPLFECEESLHTQSVRTVSHQQLTLFLDQPTDFWHRSWNHKVDLCFESWTMHILARALGSGFELTLDRLTRLVRFRHDEVFEEG